MKALLVSLALLVGAAGARADTPKRIAIELTTLAELRKQHVITEAEYQSALKDLAASTGAQAKEALTLVLARWSTTLYGFVEADTIVDTTQSFNDAAGNNQVARPGTYPGDHARFMGGVRNSRLGLRLSAPEWHRIRANALFEMDFQGNQPPGVTEAAFFTSPGFRVRHLFLRVETPIVDVLFGQTWHLFGWQALYQPCTVEIQGVPGELYSRTPQIRVSKTVHASPVTFEAALAMSRPPQRDSATPEGEAGVRLAFDRWTGLVTNGATGTMIQPLSLAVTADVRHFELPQFSAMPKAQVPKTGWAVAVDALLPLLRATDQHRGNALTALVEYAYGYGDADFYAALNGGVVNPPLPNPAGLTPAPTYSPDVDPGLVVFDAAGNAHLINWQSAMVGLQYSFPRLDGKFWISADYSHTDSNNAPLHGPPAGVRRGEDWADVNLFGDVTPAVRLGLEYALFDDHYADGIDAVDHRVQLSAFYLF